jgi:hypothetical protein
MKRRDVMREIKRQAKLMGVEVTFREGGNHTIVTLSNCVAQVPRHHEIPYGTVRKIMKDLEPELGERWLKI